MVALAEVVILFELLLQFAEANPFNRCQPTANSDEYLCHGIRYSQVIQCCSEWRTEGWNDGVPPPISSKFTPVLTTLMGRCDNREPQLLLYIICLDTRGYGSIDLRRRQLVKASNCTNLGSYCGIWVPHECTMWSTMGMGLVMQ